MESYIHDEMSREEAEAILLQSTRKLANGNYLIFRKGSEKHVLAIAYKNTCTFHLVQPRSDGVLLINKKLIVPAMSIRELVDRLSEPSVPKWPVQLTTCVTPSGEVGLDYQDSLPAQAVTAMEITKRQSVASIEKDIAPMINIHLQADDIGGPYLAPPPFNEQNHHRTSSVQHPKVQINPKAFPYIRPPAFTPPELADNDDDAFGFDDTANNQKENFNLANYPYQSPPKFEEGDEDVAAINVPQGFWRDKSFWLHDTMPRSEAEGIALAASNGVSGFFLVRQVPTNKTGETHYALLIIHDGKCTHHLIVINARKQFTLNKQPLAGMQCLEDVIKLLAHPLDGWPVQLRYPIAPATPVIINQDDDNDDDDVCDGFGDTISPLADQYMNHVEAPQRWKCGQCGNYNQIHSDSRHQGNRKCAICGAMRPRLATDQDFKNTREYKPQPSNTQPSPRQLARDELVKILSALPYDFASNIEHALQLYTRHQCSLLNLVTSLSLVCRRIDTAKRDRLEHCIGLLVAPHHKEDFELLNQRAHKEEYLELLMEQGDRKEYDILARLVARGLHLFTVGQSPPYHQMNKYQRSTHLASVKRGWAALRWQADDPSMGHFDVELVAREVHIGWGRAVRVEWDMDGYGTPASEAPILNHEGLLDSSNFATGSGYKIYSERVNLGKRLYLLPQQSSTEAVALQSRIGMGHPHGPLTNQLKEGYRVAAEVLLNAFKARYPTACVGRHVIRDDASLFDELVARDIVRLHHVSDGLVGMESRGFSQPGIPRTGLPTYDQDATYNLGDSDVHEFGF